MTFSQEDGLKSLYAKFKDAAGNETDEISATATLDTTGNITGLIVVEEKADASVALVSLLGTSITTTPGTDGQYTISNVPAGVYTVQVTVPTEVETYVPTQYGVAVEATQTSSLPNLYVELARGNLTGTIEVETLGDSTDASGVSVEVLEAGQVAITTETGAFAVSGLIAVTTRCGWQNLVICRKPFRMSPSPINKTPLSSGEVRTNCSSYVAPWSVKFFSKMGGM